MRFIESSVFSRERRKLLSDEELRAIQNDIIERPAKGSLIRGSGGLRKIRGQAKGQGKSGGVRVVYYHDLKTDNVWLLDLYAKSDKADLTPDELKTIKKRLEE